ncbi:MAG: cobalt ECF transporter T component CbiQ [Caldilineaceae bacterium]|nr:cobalt ECF transporter T component CbiQ [Caldilineaceae bacterium]
MSTFQQQPMHIHFNDSYHQGESVIHRLDPRTKILIAVGFILTVSLTPVGLFDLYLALFVMVMAVAVGSGIGAGLVLKRAFVALPFALAAVALPFTMPGEVIAVVPIFGGIDVTLEGTVRALSIMVKSWISVQAAIVLITLTPFHDLLWGLGELHVPRPIIAIVSFMYRYLFVLSDEVLRLLRARASRAAAMPGVRSGGPLLWRGKVAGYMAGGLMLRSFDRSERIYNAMAARGYDGEIRSFTQRHFHTADFVAGGIAGVVLVSILLLAYR